MNDNETYPNVPGFKGSADTGREAAADMKEHCGRLQRMALRAIREAGQVREDGTGGLTADELAAKLEMDRWSIQPRTSELRRKHLIDDSGHRRRNVTGKRAVVWVAVDRDAQIAQAEGKAA